MDRLPRTSTRLTTLVLTTLALVTALAVATPTTGAAATVGWAPAAQATVHPGVQTFTDGAQCTANFVFTGVDAAGDAQVWLGQSAHCAGTGAATDTDGCTATSLPLGTPVEVTGADRPGTLAYSSWLTMEDVEESDPATCAYNDFALIALHPDDHDVVNPSVPFWGGPVGLGVSTAPMETVHTYGNSSLRLGLSALSPKEGTSLGQSADGWNHPVYTATPGVPGDSGSAFLGADGHAIGTLSTLALAPLAGSNGVTDLASALAYLAEHTDLEVRLEPGTEPFVPLLP